MTCVIIGISSCHEKPKTHTVNSSQKQIFFFCRALTSSKHPHHPETPDHLQFSNFTDVLETSPHPHIPTIVRVAPTQCSNFTDVLETSPTGARTASALLLLLLLYRRPRNILTPRSRREMLTSVNIHRQGQGVVHAPSFGNITIMDK